MWSCPLFFRSRSFLPWCRQHFSFSHSRYKIFMLFFKRNWSPLFFLSLTLALSLLSTPMQTFKLSRKKESASLLLFFISKSPGVYATYCHARVLEMQHFNPTYMKGWTYVRTIFSEPKFLGCIVYQIFLPMVLLCARFASESSANKSNIIQLIQKGIYNRICFGLQVGGPIAREGGGGKVLLVVWLTSGSLRYQRSSHAQSTRSGVPWIRK